MNNLIKSAFVAQVILGIIALIHNFSYNFKVEKWQYLIFASLIIGVFLTWQVIFNKQISKSTKIWAVLIGTIPTLFILGAWALIAISLH